MKEKGHTSESFLLRQLRLFFVVVFVVVVFSRLYFITAYWFFVNVTSSFVWKFVFVCLAHGFVRHTRSSCRLQKSMCCCFRFYYTKTSEKMKSLFKKKDKKLPKQTNPVPNFHVHTHAYIYEKIKKNYINANNFFLFPMFRCFFGCFSVCYRWNKSTDRETEWEKIEALLFIPFHLESCITRRKRTYIEMWTYLPVLS